MINTVLIDEFNKKLKGKNNILFNNETFLEGIKRNDLLPYDDRIIRFSSDVWEIHKVNKSNLAKVKFKIDFSDINYQYKDIVKGVIYKYCVLDELSVNTIKAKFKTIRDFMDYLAKRRIYNLQTITLREVLKFLEKIDSGKAHYKQSYKIAIKDILQFIEINNLVDTNEYIDVFRYFNKNKETEELRVEKENSKTPEIPIDLFNKLVSCAKKIIESSTAGVEEKIEACIIILLSQTGLRIGELRLLKRNAMYDVSIFNDSEKVYYLNYVSPKAKKKNAKTFMTNLAKNAYEYLSSNSNENSEYLFSNSKGNLYDDSKLRAFIIYFCIRNHKELDCLNRKISTHDGLSIIKYEDFKKANNYVSNKLSVGISKGDYIAYPIPHQFRVSVCNWLLRSGRSIDWVREHMNHLDYETTMHYSRRREEDKKEKEVATVLLKEVINNNIKLIGKDSQILMTKVNEFIKEGNYNVVTDIDVIIEKLQGKIPIRQKESGYCIKSSFGRKCAHDGYGQDIYCAFGVCPNHFTTYKMVDISYATFCDLKRTINYNIKNNFTSQANMELNKLKRVIEEALLPEIQELKNEIDKRGEDEIISSNKNIKDIVQRLDSILKEVNEWKIKKLEQI